MDPQSLKAVDCLPNVFSLSKDLYSIALETKLDKTHSGFAKKNELESKFNRDFITLYPQESIIYEIERYETKESNYEAQITAHRNANFGSSMLQTIIQQSANQPFYSSPTPPSSPSISSGNSSLKQFNYVNLDTTTPEDLPNMALPILKFMEKVQPHIVIGCDRGGRLFGLAMHAAWRQTRDGQPFPTLDGALHFARISKVEDSDVLQEKIDQIVASSKQIGAQRGNAIADDEQLRVLFVDDWITGGGTMRLARQLMEKHDAQTYFAVMCGPGADATGSPNRNTTVSWHDHPQKIGINYLSTVGKTEDGTITQQHEVVAVRSTEAHRNRQRIQQAAKVLRTIRVLGQVA